jgi:hypothetical protein
LVDGIYQCVKSVEVLGALVGDFGHISLDAVLAHIRKNEVYIGLKPRQAHVGIFHVAQNIPVCRSVVEMTLNVPRSPL